MVNLHIVIIEPEYGDNLGLIARVIKNFGADGLVLVNPKIEIEDARQRAMHAQDILDNALIINDYSHHIFSNFHNQKDFYNILNCLFLSYFFFCYFVHR